MTVEMISTRDAARISGATFRQLDYWERTGVLTASVPAKGSGSRRYYTDREVHVATVLAALSEACCNNLHGLLCDVSVAARPGGPFEVDLGHGLTLRYIPMIDEDEET